MEEKIILEIKNLTKNFNRGRETFEAVSEVDFKMNKGDFTQLIGKSGSGKTTFLSMILGLINPYKGSINILGEDFLNLSETNKDKFRNKHIGYVPQGIGVLNNLSIYDNIRLPYYLQNKEYQDINKKILDLLNELGIEDLKDMYPSSLSGGEIKRVMIARALINDPEIIIVDEPTSDLDTENTKIVMDILSRINKTGKSILMVTHELETLEYGNSYIEFKEGKIIDRRLL